MNPMVEGLRGLAAWMVVYSHYWPGPDGPWALQRFFFTGVDFFFVLSGFVFAPYFFGRPLPLGAYAVRRLFRIYPAYLLALLLYIGLKWQADQPLAYVWQHLVFAHLQSREMTFYYNPVFWSLPSEVEFYALLPLLCGFCRSSPWRLLALGLLALVLRCALGYWSDSATQNAAYILMHHLPGMLVEFLLGVGAWALSRRGLRRSVRVALVAGGLVWWLVLAAWFAAVGDAGIHASLARGQISWLAALAFAAMVAGTVTTPATANAKTSATAPRPWVGAALWAGQLSYGSYLFHIAALQLLTPYASFLGRVDVTLAAALLTLLMAWVCYRFWENPWRKHGRALAARMA